MVPAQFALSDLEASSGYAMCRRGFFSVRGSKRPWRVRRVGRLCGAALPQARQRKALDFPGTMLCIYVLERVRGLVWREYCRVRPGWRSAG